MAEVERGWFRRFAGLDVPKRNQAGADPDAALNGVVADPAKVAEAWAAWGEEITFAEQFTRDHDPRFAGRDSEGRRSRSASASTGASVSNCAPRGRA